MAPAMTHFSRNSTTDLIPITLPRPQASTLPLDGHKFRPLTSKNLFPQLTLPSPSDLRTTDLAHYPILRAHFLHHHSRNLTDLGLPLRSWLALEHWLSTLTLLTRAHTQRYSDYIETLTDEAAVLANEPWKFKARQLIHPPREIQNATLVPGRSNEEDEIVRKHASYYRQRLYRQRVLIVFVGWVCGEPVEVVADGGERNVVWRSGGSFWRGLNERFEGTIKRETLGMWRELEEGLKELYLRALPRESVEFLTGAAWVERGVEVKGGEMRSMVEGMAMAVELGGGVSEILVAGGGGGGGGPEPEGGDGDYPDDEDNNNSSDDDHDGPGDLNNMNNDHGNNSDEKPPKTRPAPPAPPNPETYGTLPWNPPHPAFRPPSYLADRITVTLNPVTHHPPAPKDEGEGTKKQRAKKGGENSTFSLELGHLWTEITKTNGKTAFMCQWPGCKSTPRGGVKTDVGADGDATVMEGKNNIKRHVQQHLNLDVYCPIGHTRDGKKCEPSRNEKTRQDKFQEHYAEKHPEEERALITNWLLAMGRQRTFKPNWIAGVFWSRLNSRKLRREEMIGRPALDNRRMNERNDFFKLGLWILLSSGQHCSHLQDTIEILDADAGVVLGTQRKRVKEEMKYLEERLCRYTPHQLWSGRRCIFGQGNHRNTLNTSTLGLTISPLSSRNGGSALNLPKPVDPKDPEYYKNKRNDKRRTGKGKIRKIYTPRDPGQRPADDFRDETCSAAIRKTFIRESRRDDYALTQEDPSRPCDFPCSFFCQKCYCEEYPKTLTNPPQTDHEILMEQWPLPPGELFYVDPVHGLHYWVDHPTKTYWCQWMADGSIRRYHPESLTYTLLDKLEGADHPFLPFYLQNTLVHREDYLHAVTTAHHMVNQSRAIWYNYNRFISDTSLTAQDVNTTKKAVSTIFQVTQMFIAFSQPRFGVFHPEAKAAMEAGDKIVPTSSGNPFWGKNWEAWEKNAMEDERLRNRLIAGFKKGMVAPQCPQGVGRLLEVDTVLPCPWRQGREPKIMELGKLETEAGGMELADAVDTVPSGGNNQGGMVQQAVQPTTKLSESINLEDLGLDDARNILFGGLLDMGKVGFTQQPQLQQPPPQQPLQFRPQHPQPLLFIPPKETFEPSGRPNKHSGPETPYPRFPQSTFQQQQQKKSQQFSAFTTVEGFQKQKTHQSPEPLHLNTFPNVHDFPDFPQFPTTTTDNTNIDPQLYQYDDILNMEAFEVEGVEFVANAQMKRHLQEQQGETGLGQMWEVEKWLDFGAGEGAGEKKS